MLTLYCQKDGIADPGPHELRSVRFLDPEPASEKLSAELHYDLRIFFLSTVHS